MPSNAKGFAKKFSSYITFIVTLIQPLQPLVPNISQGVILPLPAAIHRLSPMEENSTIINENYPKIANTPEPKVDKITLTDEQIKQFSDLALQLNNGSITIEEAILQLRGGSGVTDLMVVFAFVVFINWYDSFVFFCNRFSSK